MARVFISLSGEGRGHATRARAVAERLQVHHDVSIFASGQSLEFLRSAFADGSIRVRRIPGPRFHYDRGGGFRAGETLLRGARFFGGLPAHVIDFCRIVRDEEPDLGITDFESVLPAAFQVARIPFISLTHQHFLTTFDLSDLPVRLRLRAEMMGMVVRGYYTGQSDTLVSSFYCPGLRRWTRSTVPIGVLLRERVRNARPENKGHLTVYMRRFHPPALLDTLRAARMPAHVYGLGERPSEGEIHFHAVDERRFVDHLAGCHSLICTAGNQLVGEALYLGKPVLGLPEMNNPEQAINGRFLRASGCGEDLSFEHLDKENLLRFLDRSEAYRDRGDRAFLDGLPAALRVIRDRLARTGRGRINKPLVAVAALSRSA